MTKGKIVRVVFTQGTTVTLPQPVGSRSSLDLEMHDVVIRHFPDEHVLRIFKKGMPVAKVVPLSHVNSWDEELTEDTAVTEVKRGPGRPAKVEPAQH